MFPKPAAKLRWATTCGKPIPAIPRAKTTVDAARVPPTTAWMLTELDRQEQEPEGLVEIAVAPVQFCCANRVEAFIVRISTILADTVSGHGFEPRGSAYACYQVSQKRVAPIVSGDPGQGASLTLEPAQRQVEEPG